MYVLHTDWLNVQYSTVQYSVELRCLFVTTVENVIVKKLIDEKNENFRFNCQTNILSGVFYFEHS